MFIREYFFNPGPFSSAMLVYRSVTHLLTIDPNLRRDIQVPTIPKPEVTSDQPTVTGRAIICTEIHSGKLT